jgi:hypothetical protein
MISPFVSESLHILLSSVEACASLDLTIYKVSYFPMYLSLKENVLPAAERLDIAGGIALTELGHGSNANAVETTATYDPKTNEFIIHTPSESAQKYWTGNSTVANAVLVMAQLIIDNEKQGVHGCIHDYCEIILESLLHYCSRRSQIKYNLHFVITRKLLFHYEIQMALFAKV